MRNRLPADGGIKPPLQDGGIKQRGGVKPPLQDGGVKPRGGIKPPLRRLVGVALAAALAGCHKAARVAVPVAIAAATVAAPAAAQGVRYDNVALSARGLPIAGASVAVCTIAGNTSTQPCSPLASIWSDRAETTPLANPTTTSGLGNYGFFASPGSYLVQIYGASVSTPQVYTITLPCDPSSSTACTTTAGITTTGAISTGALSVTGNISATGTVSGSNVPTAQVPSVSGAITTGDCVKWASGTTIADAGVAGCGSANAALKPASSDAIQYVSPNGNNANDGHSWGTAVADLYTAWNNLVTTAGNPNNGSYGVGGTIFVAANSVCGGPTANQGLWVIGPGDVNFLAFISNNTIKITAMSRTSNVVTVTLNAAPPSLFIVGAAIRVSGATDSSFNGSFTVASVGASSFTYNQTAANASVTNATIIPTSWVLQQPVTVKGVGLTTVEASAPGISSVLLTCGQTGVTNKAALSLAGVNVPINFENLDFKGFAQIGQCSNGTNNCGTTTVRFFNDAFVVPNNVNFGPPVFVTAASFWIWFDHCTMTSSSGTTGGTDARQGIVLDPGTITAGNVGLVFIRDTNINDGGIVYHGEHGGGNGSVYVDGFTTEAQTDTMAGVTIYSPWSVTASIKDVTVADNSGTGFSGYGVVAEPAPGNSWSGSPDPTNIVVSNVGRTAGPVTRSGVVSVTSATGPWPSIGPMNGFWKGRIFGQVDAARRTFGAVSARFVNLATSSFPSGWLGTFGARSCGVTCSQTATTAPDGTSNAGAMTTTSTGSVSPILGFQSATLASGDFIIAGGWWQLPSGNTLGPSVGQPLAISAVDCTAGALSPINGLATVLSGPGNYAFGNTTLVSHNWVWSAVAAKVTTAYTGTCSLYLYGLVDSTHAINYFAPVLLHVASGTISDEEAAEIGMNLPAYSKECATASSCLLPGQTISFDPTSSGFTGTITTAALTANQTLTLPNASGTVALTSQLPLSGSVAGSTVALAANSCGDAVTATVTGATTTMVATASPQGAVPDSALVWVTFVSAANTVTLRYCNVSTVSVTPVATTFSIRVIQ